MERQLEDLPGHVRDRILGLGIPDPDRFASVSFPALGDQSIVEAMGQRDGEEAVLSLLERLEGYLGRARGQASESC